MTGECRTKTCEKSEWVTENYKGLSWYLWKLQ
jgi:hypothetical protein